MSKENKKIKYLLNKSFILTGIFVGLFSFFTGRNKSSSPFTLFIPEIPDYFSARNKFTKVVKKINLF